LENDICVSCELTATKVASLLRPSFEGFAILTILIHCRSASDGARRQMELGALAIGRLSSDETEVG